MLEQPRFGQRLRELRLQRGLSQAALVGVGMSAGYLSRLESGLRPPTSTAVEYLADRIGVPVGAFEESPAVPSDVEVVKALSAPDEESAGTLLAAVADDGRRAAPALRWLALWQLAQLRGQQGRSAEEGEAAQRLLRISDELDVPELQVRSRILQARLLRARSDMATAYTLAAEAHTLVTRHRLQATDLLRVLLVLISTEVEVGRLPDALVHLSELEESLPGAPDRIAVDALWTSANVLVRHGDFAGAAARLQDALARHDSRTDLKLWLRLRFAAASLYLQMTPPRVGEAEGLMGEAEAALRLVGTEQQQIEFQVIMAHLRFAQGRLQDAEELCAAVGGRARSLALRDRIRFEVLVNRIRILSGLGEVGVPAIEDLARQAHDAANADLAAEIWRSLAETLASGQSLRPRSGAGGESTGPECTTERDG